MAIEPKSQDWQARLDIALAKLASDDALLQVSIDRESGQIILKGTSESHHEGKVAELERGAIRLNVGSPQVAFLERPTMRAEVDYKYRKQLGPVRQFAAVTLAVEPGRGYQFESRIDTVPEAYIPYVRKGIDSSPLAFEIAARGAFREALRKANSVLLEPIMKVEVTTPAEYAKATIADLGLRRGHIEQNRVNAAIATICAIVPLMNMFGYENDLKAISKARATFTMQFDRYAPAPPQPSDDPPFRPAIGMRA